MIKHICIHTYRYIHMFPAFVQVEGRRPEGRRPKRQLERCRALGSFEAGCSSPSDIYTWRFSSSYKYTCKYLNCIHYIYICILATLLLTRFMASLGPPSGAEFWSLPRLVVKPFLFGMLWQAVHDARLERIQYTMLGHCSWRRICSCHVIR